MTSSSGNRSAHRVIEPASDRHVPYDAEMTTPSSNVPQKLPKAGFIAAPIVFVVAAIVGIVMIISSFVVLANMITGFETVSAGSSTTMQLSKGEWWVIGQGPTSMATQQVRVLVEDPDGNIVAPKSSSDSYSASSDGLKYQSLGSFDVPSPGSYTVSVDGPSGTGASLGRISLTGFIGLLVGGIVIGVLGFVIAAVLLIVTLVRRGRAKRDAVAMGSPSATTAAPAPPPPPPAPV